jgi:Arc/MetJ-type ribon-helix-helix transcriptional regulator
MSDQPKEVEKTRISVTLTRPYLDALNRLVTEGVYLSKGEIILEALRRLLRQQGIEPFRLESVEESEEPE